MLILILDLYRFKNLSLNKAQKKLEIINMGKRIEKESEKTLN